MSHACLIVITNSQSKSLEDLMEPFNENNNDSLKGLVSPKWDWYRVGGRWDGEMLGLDPIPDDRGGFNFGDEYTSLERNQCFVSHIDSKFKPFAVLTPDGVWHERGEMGWFGIVSDEKKYEDWDTEYKELLSKYADDLATLVDYHI